MSTAHSYEQHLLTKVVNGIAELSARLERIEALLPKLPRPPAKVKEAPTPKNGDPEPRQSGLVGDMAASI